MSPLSIVVRMHHTGRRRSQEAAALSLRKDQPRLLRSRSEGIFIAVAVKSLALVTCPPSVIVPGVSSWEAFAIYLFCRAGGKVAA